MQMDRLKTLVDGTMAIVLTLLVLLIKPPPPEEASGKVLQDLLTQWDYIVAYALSFVLIGLYWLNHHSIFHYINRCTLPLVWFNVMFLLWVAFIPFPTTLLVEYPEDEFAIVVYGIVHIICGLILAAMWRYALTGHRLVHPNIDAGVARRITQKLVFPPALYVIAILVSFFSRPLSLAAFVLVPILHVILDRSDLYVLLGGEE